MNNLKMLGKQMKYDFIFGARMFLGAAAALMAMGAVMWVVSFISPQSHLFFGVMEGSAYIMMGVMIFCCTLIFSLYSRQFFGQVGQLMLTLPVGRGVQLISKYIVAMCWMAFIFVTFMLSTHLGAVNIESTGVWFNVMGPDGNVLTGWDTVGMGIQIVVVAFCVLAIIYFAVTLAHSAFGRVRLSALPAGIIGVGYFSVFMVVFGQISGRAREVVTVYEEIGPNHISAHTFTAPAIGMDVGRIPLGAGYVDIYLVAATLAFALAAAGVTYWLLRKKISLG